MKSKSLAKTKVIVAMSGGVDSSVAALLMKKKGHEVVGVFMKNWSSHGKSGIGECDWVKERSHAMKIAEILNIPLITFDFEREYRRDVIDKMFNDYRSGKTPNPDIDCNEKVKFPLLIRTMKRLKANYIVTGHYARIKKKGKKFKLLRAKDESKDQSYFLYRMRQSELAKTLFPIGDHTKKQVREIAKRNHFPNHDKKSTLGICFIGKTDMKKFLKRKIKPKKGRILSPEGKVIGEHDGIYYYTIGQRIGPRFGIDVSKTTDSSKKLRRWYVAKKNPKKNEIIAAPQGHKMLYREGFFLKSPYWIGKKPKPNKKLSARIRHIGKLLPSKISSDNGRYEVSLSKPIAGLSQGQACVLYKGKTVLGGGEIRF